MNALVKTLAILAVVVLTTQTVRHAYLLWFEPRGSVLDRYDQPLKSAISSARSLDDLVALYDPIRKEADRARAEAKQTQGETTYGLPSDREPFKSENSLREAVKDWEGKAKEIRSVRFYCATGLCLLVLGTAIFRFANRWLGLAFQIAAFSEFVYWTSPTFFGGPGREFDRLLATKLLFSASSLALLFAVAAVQRAFGETKA